MEKLSKLITLWTSKNKFFSEETLDQMKNPGNSLTKYKADLAEQFRSVVEEVIINFYMRVIIVISKSCRLRGRSAAPTATTSSSTSSSSTTPAATSTASRRSWTASSSRSRSSALWPAASSRPRAAASLGGTGPRPCRAARPRPSPAWRRPASPWSTCPDLRLGSASDPRSPRGRALRTTTSLPG